MAEVIVMAPEAGVKEKIKTFDKAWHRALELPTPVSLVFNGFVRKDAKSEPVVYD